MTTPPPWITRLTQAAQQQTYGATATPGPGADNGRVFVGKPIRAPLPDPGSLLQGPQRDAYLALKSLFDSYGLDSLASKIFGYVKQGYGSDTISILLQDTSEYKARFAGNEARIKAGLPVLSPSQYLATEDSYRQILQDAGMPKGFYDTPADFASWIAGDVSPTEIKGRVDAAVQNAAQASDATKQALQSLYGVDQNHVVAYFLDRSRALPILQKQAQAAQFGGEALKRGLGLDKGNLEDMATSGLSLGQVATGYQQIAQTLPDLQAIAQRWGVSFSQNEAEQDVLTQSGGAASTKRRTLASQERGLFDQAAGTAQAGLGPAYQQG